MGKNSSLRLEEVEGRVSHEEFDRWVHLHTDELLKLAHRLAGNYHLAEDMVQETFRTAWRGRHLFDPRRGSPIAWLTTILYRRHADWRRESQYLCTNMTDHWESSILDYREVMVRGFSDEMQHALAALPGRYLDALLLVVVAGLTHLEAAKVLGVPHGSVLRRVYEAKQMLYKHLSCQTGRMV
jgi:RNA polymerase sigma-70 factor, ECF subfamily